MSPLFERCKVSTFNVGSSFGDRIAVAGFRLFVKLQDHRASGTVLQGRRQLTQAMNGLFK